MSAKTINGVKYNIKSKGRRVLHTWNDVPSKVRVGQFQYVVDQNMEEHASCDFINDDYRFFKFRDYWYDVYEFESAGDTVKALGFEGFSTDSFWSFVAIGYFDKDGYELDNEITVAFIHY